MNAVVHTNVIAYYLLGTEPFVDEVQGFWRAVGQPMAPAVWAAEFANVIWMAVRHGVLAEEEGHRRLDYAARLHVRSMPIRSLWQAALGRSLASNIAVHDTLFVELAVRRRVPLVTFDVKLLGAFPGVACRPATLLRS